MEHIPASSMPHIVQVYQHHAPTTKIQTPQIIHISHPSLQTTQGKVTYQQSISSGLHIPSTEHVGDMSQIVMSCQQAHLPSIPSNQPQQVLQSDLSQVQFTSHVILPQVPVFKQHMLMDRQQYYEQYEAFLKEPHCIVTEMEPVVRPPEKVVQCKAETTQPVEMEVATGIKKRSRSLVPNPSTWACNVRKQKHQKGEAYINRRGKVVPERCVRNTKNCLTNCKYKCNERINDTDREQIFKAFYSLNANEKKHFLLNTTERNYVKNCKITTSSKRKYSFKYFFLVRDVRYTVCKNFYLGTLAISQKPVYNVHLGKSEMNIPKPDGRGLSEASAHALPSNLKDKVRKHILSFKTEDSKSVKQFSRKRQYLDCSLSIKQMYNMFVTECEKDNVTPVKESMYRKIFKQEFNLHFKKIKTEPLCGKCRGPVKKK